MYPLKATNIILNDYFLIFKIGDLRFHFVRDRYLAIIEITFYQLEGLYP